MRPWSRLRLRLRGRRGRKGGLLCCLRRLVGSPDHCQLFGIVVFVFCVVWYIDLVPEHGVNVELPAVYFW